MKNIIDTFFHMFSATFRLFDTHAMSAVAWILLFKKFKAEGRFYEKVLLPVSNASYDVYLMHLLILVPVCGFFREWLGSATDGVLGFWTTPVQIMVSAVVAFIATSIVGVVLRRILAALKIKI